MLLERIKQEEATYCQQDSAGNTHHLFSSTIRKPANGYSTTSTESGGVLKAAEAVAAVCCIARNETLYLDEWIIYQRSVLGFSQIYLFDNSIPDGAELRGRYCGLRGVHVIPWPGNYKPQLAAYDMCVRIIREHNKEEESKRLYYNDGDTQQKVEWVAFFDIDEFLVLKNETETVVDLLNDVIPLDTKTRSSSSGGFLGKLLPGKRRASLSINWLLFGTSNQTKYKPEPVTSRFTYRKESVDEHIKSIARVDSIDVVNQPHYATLRSMRYQTVDTDGNILSRNSPYNPGGPMDRAAVHHYCTKSEEEYFYKGCVRGRSDSDPSDSNYRDRCRESPYPGDVYDASAWEALKRWVPDYSSSQRKS